MKRSSNRILTTHVGSLIRPAALQEFLRATAGRQTLRRDRLSEVPDGFRRRSRDASRPRPASTSSATASSASRSAGRNTRWSGCPVSSAAPIKSEAANPFKRGADRTRFAEFYAELDAREGVATTTEAICVGPIKYTGQAELQRDIDNFKAALKTAKVEEAFLPVAAPASVIPDRKNEYYKSEEELQAAIAGAMRTEYKMIIDAGFLVQLDDARNAVTYDRMVPPASFADYKSWLAQQVEIINHAIEGLPQDRIRYQIIASSGLLALMRSGTSGPARAWSRRPSRPA